MARRVDGSESLSVNPSAFPLLCERHTVESEVRGSTRLLGWEGLEVEQLRGWSGIFLATSGTGKYHTNDWLVERVFLDSPRQLKQGTKKDAWALLLSKSTMSACTKAVAMDGDTYLQTL